MDTTATFPHGDKEDVRCDCGNLLARWTDAGIELKCRRCKRCIYIVPPPAPSAEHPRPPPTRKSKR